MPKGKRGPEHPGWKGDAASDNTKRGRARNYFALGSCENCSAQAYDRHHKDGNTGNNKRSNIAILCRRCHMVEDGRLERLIQLVPTPPLPPRPCTNCSRVVKRIWHGECEACYVFERRTGKKRPPVIANLRQERAATHAADPCSGCGRPKNWGSTAVKGMCGSCYQISWRERKAG